MKILNILLTIISLCFVLCGCTPERAPTDISRETQKEIPKTFPDPDRTITASYSSSILDHYSISNGTLRIVLKDPETVTDYFESGDKLNKLFAIETVRLLYKIPDITVLELTANIAMGSYHMNVTKDQVEEFYGISIYGLREFDGTGELMIGDRWRNDFLRRFDSKGKRAEFVKKFVKK